MRSFKTFILIAAAISSITVIGAAVYEHTTLVPTWSAAPPASLAMFQGDYGFSAETFWKSIHPVSILLLIATLIANWKTDRRRLISIALGGYVLILVVTAIYFVPELLEIINTPYSTTVDPSLVKRAQLWETLSLVRLGFLIVLFGGLLYSLTKGNETRQTYIQPAV